MTTHRFDPIDDLLKHAIAMLERGRLVAGWALYQVRLDHPNWVPWAVRESINHHRDRLLKPGDPVDGRRVVVFTEQGLGDNIMFARFIPLLAAAGARVILACPPDLHPLLARIEGVQQVLSPPPEHPMGKLNLGALAFDAFTPIMSLPHVFGTTLDSIPINIPYLRADPEHVEAWRARYAAAGRAKHRRVGIVFQSNTGTRSAAQRSMTVAEVKVLAGIPEIDLINLQPGPVGRSATAAIPGMVDACAEPMTLDAYAAAIAATDVLISVDTMAAHCAGAMGHPVQVALPATADWRWGRDATTTPWYASATLFRQAADQSWDEVVAGLCAVGA